MGITDANKEICDIIRTNLENLRNYWGADKSGFLNFIEERCGPTLDRTTFSKFINGKNSSISVAFLKMCCQAFNVSMDELVSEKFNPENSNMHAFWEISTYIPKYQKQEYEIPSYPINEMFVQNPYSHILKNYIQNYYCYYFSTVSSENKVESPKNAIITGRLKLEPDGDKCKAILEVDTKENDDKGQRIVKRYEGNLIVCPSIQSVHCIMHLPEGEFCFIIFRYSHLNNKKQLCRIAEVLSTSSAVDKRYPIVHRMLLCKEKILDEHLDVIAPYICLNYSDITISKDELSAIEAMSRSYASIIEEVKKEECEQMYRIKERRVRDKAKELLNEDELTTFLTALRSHSLAYHYNKVSKTADNNIFKQLIQLGYFNNEL